MQETDRCIEKSRREKDPLFRTGLLRCEGNWSEERTKPRSVPGESAVWEGGGKRTKLKSPVKSCRWGEGGLQDRPACQRRTPGALPLLSKYRHHRNAITGVTASPWLRIRADLYMENCVAHRLTRMGKASGNCIHQVGKAAHLSVT